MKFSILEFKGGSSDTPEEFRQRFPVGVLLDVTAARDLSAGTVIQAADLTITGREIDIADYNDTEDPARRDTAR